MLCEGKMHPAKLLSGDIPGIGNEMFSWPWFEYHSILWAYCKSTVLPTVEWCQMMLFHRKWSWIPKHPEICHHLAFESWPPKKVTLPLQNLTKTAFLFSFKIDPTNPHSPHQPHLWHMRCHTKDVLRPWRPQATNSWSFHPNVAATQWNLNQADGCDVKIGRICLKTSGRNYVKLEGVRRVFVVGLVWNLFLPKFQFLETSQSLKSFDRLYFLLHHRHQSFPRFGSSTSTKNHWKNTSFQHGNFQAILIGPRNNPRWWATTTSRRLGSQQPSSPRLHDINPSGVWWKGRVGKCDVNFYSSGTQPI